MVAILSAIRLDDEMMLPSSVRWRRSENSVCCAFGRFTTARKIVVADVGHGEGRYVVTPALLKLPIPANVIAGAYCTVANMSIGVGP